MRKINTIFIHCSATKENTDYTEQQLKASHLARGIRSPMGYHYYIRKSGKIVYGRTLNQIGAHVRGHNTSSIGICYEGGLDEKGNYKDTRTKEQKCSILEAIKECISAIKTDGQDVSNLEIKGHRDVSPDLNKDGVITPNEWIKGCPCFSAIPEYKWITN